MVLFASDNGNTKQMQLKTIVDGAYRLLYRVGYRTLKFWWFLRRPRQEGVVVGVWHGRRVLLTRSSYHSWIGLPGGGRRRGEPAKEAAARELFEELRLQVHPENLELGRIISHQAEYRLEDLPFMELEVESEPRLELDNREIVWAGFVDIDNALSLNLFPPVRIYLQDKLRDFCLD